MYNQVQEVIREATLGLDDELVSFRRDLHAHPEVGFNERRTTSRLVQRLTRAGLHPQPLKMGTGLVCEIVPREPVPVLDGERRPARVGLRADIDALPINDTKDVAYASTQAGVAHACGHDVHTTIVLGAGLVLARLRDRGLLRNTVRLIFQPAEEVSPGGATEVIAEGALEGLDEVYALHCDPRTDVGQVALKKGPITSAADRIRVSLSGPGGHTSRPHTTSDVVAALGTVITQAPLVLSRRLDPRSGTSLIWGHVQAGTAENAIPRHGVVAGTMRTLTVEGWERARTLLPEVLEHLVAPFDVAIEVDFDEGLPPTVNHPAGVDRLIDAAQSQLGRGSVTRTEQSLGGEDFSWMLQRVPGAMARLGVRSPGETDWPDIHRPYFDVDEGCIAVGVQVLSRVAAVGAARLS
ncbi:amidohydrolase [Desertihabitans brevis]|uniref:Amidohydrolase n=1 Tax=Desertihabitans brevis TaxID=2268447 RepID=A0A367YSZ7_9ACTN|nr:amidohydrolase [Desertihabitans brevis]RCK68910.1 amidohydrolase [Desertihabitans brevis]